MESIKAIGLKGFGSLFLHYTITMVVLVPVVLLSICQEQGRNKLTFREQFMLNCSNLEILCLYGLIIKSIIVLALLDKIESVNQVSYNKLGNTCIAVLVLSLAYLISIKSVNVVFFNQFQALWEANVSDDFHV